MVATVRHRKQRLCRAQFAYDNFLESAIAGLMFRYLWAVAIESFVVADLTIQPPNLVAVYPAFNLSGAGSFASCCSFRFLLPVNSHTVSARPVPISKNTKKA